MIVQKITPHIIRLIFPSQATMCRTMMRFGEHFESPRFRGEVFTRTQFRRWYEGATGAFTYYKDWSGFNIPGHCFRPFIDGAFNPLTKAEQAVVKAMVRQKSLRFYVIATVGRKGSWRHELAHAFYYVDQAYREEVDGVLATLPKKSKIKRVIQNEGYHPDVLDDELHAYMVDGVDMLPLGLLSKQARVLYDRGAQQLGAIFDRYYARIGDVTISPRKS